MPLFTRVASLILLATMSRPPPGAVTRIRVVKSAHAVELYSGETLVERDTAAIGPGGSGPKRREGDRVTPVGRYHIAARHRSDHFDVFLLLDYPNSDDRERFRQARASGELPKTATIGGDVGLHGGSPADWPDGQVQDWTLGCIAVDNAAIERIAARVLDGTPIDIED